MPQSALDRTRPAWVVAAITIVTLVLVVHVHELLNHLAAYKALHHHYPFYIAESIDKIGGALVCAAAVWMLRRQGFRDISRELGLSAPLLPAFAFALIASAPMLIGFVLTRKLTPHIQILPLLFLTVFSPLVEEIEFRGFGVLQLERGTRWPFWLAVWPSALLFGWGHIEQGQNFREMAGLMALITTGGVIFGWLVHRWQNLWVPIALHICMNLWWDLFSVSRSALGGWFPFMLQNSTMLLAIVITLYKTRPQPVAGAH